MLFPKKEVWQEWGIEKEPHRFFVQRWYEIFSEETYDSWQIRTSNVKTILNEILDAIDVVGRVHTFHRNIEFLIDEAIKISKKDFIISDFIPYVPDYLLNLKEKYNSDVKNESKKDLPAFKRLVMVLLGHISEYKKALINALRQMIADPPEKHYKKKLYSLTMALGVELKSEGYSISSLQESHKILTDNTEPYFSNRFEKLIEVFTSSKDTYECRFLISWPGDIVDLDEYEVKIERGRTGEINTPEEIGFFNQDNQPLVAILKVESIDPFSARSDAENKLENLFAYSILYRPNKKPIIKHPLVLVSPSQGSKKLVKPDTSRLMYMRDSKKAEENIKEFTILHKKLSAQDSGQLTASLQHHKLSMNAATDEARLVTLWIALESLMQHGPGNIIEKICTYVPPCISLDYVFQMMRNLPINIRALWRGSNTEELRIKLAKSTNYYLHPADMLDILLDDEDGDKIKGFLQFATDHPLLVYRVYHLWEDMFRTPEKLSKTIESHNKNVEWQLSRIYRARNLVMHQGFCPPRTRQLIQHLHSYYILTMHNLIGDLKRNPSWSIFDAFEHRLLLYDHFQNRLKNNINKPLRKSELLSPFLSLTNADGEIAWKYQDVEG